MNHKKKILLIVEGEVTEPRLLGRRNANTGLLPFMEISDYDIVEFHNPIYELYRKYKDGEYDDLVAFLASEGKLKLAEGETPRTAFSAVYLIFDFDPQYHLYNDRDIREMLEIFDNETENGKLYINYPMVEACMHIKSLPDPDFAERTVPIDGLSSNSYKKLVNRETCFRHLHQNDFRHIIMHNYNKAKVMDGTPTSDINHKNILKRQIDKKNTSGSIYTLGLLPTIAIEYNLDLTCKSYSLVLSESTDIPQLVLQ